MAAVHLAAAEPGAVIMRVAARVVIADAGVSGLARDGLDVIAGGAGKGDGQGVLVQPASRP
jgi:hypothetical protein